VAAMYASLGLCGNLTHFATGEPNDLRMANRTNPALRDTVENKLQELYARSKEMGERNRGFIVKLSLLFRMRGRVSGDAIRELYAKEFLTTPKAAEVLDRGQAR